MARISIIIPHWGTVSQLEDTLVSVLAHRPDDSQVVVVLRDLYGDPYDLKDEVSFVCAPIGTDAIRCVNLGVDASDGAVVHVLAPGVEVRPGWVEAALAHFDDPCVAAVAPLVLPHGPEDGRAAIGLEYFRRGAVRSLAPETLADRLAGRKPCRWCPDPRAGFYRRSALDRFGRFAIELGWPLAAIDFAMVMDEIGCRSVAEPRSCVSAGPEERVSASTLRRTIEVERLFWRWAARHGWLRAVAAHAGEVLFDTARQMPVLGTLPALAGRVAGLLTAHAARDRRRRQVQRQAPRPADRYAVERPHFVRQSEHVSCRS